MHVEAATADARRSAKAARRASERNALSRIKTGERAALARHRDRVLAIRARWNAFELIGTDALTGWSGAHLLDHIQRM
jgi:hypothetical protein